ncbi:excinuclease ABC subunit UvrC [Virgifigura deserti]|uniref:excinuclease ABC subunit UvrC n=1 Tax=Virgifigura deserti TaxID=2268457 RepID=UPI003CCB85C9
MKQDAPLEQESMQQAPEQRSGLSEPDMGHAGSIAHGVAVIQAQLKTLPGSPGVYRMLNAKGDALYVGKARNLKRRVASYTQIAKLPNRLQRMVAETVALEVITTHTEVEALLLEGNLIKRLMPRYNVLLRDDKSFPFITITGNHPAPQLAKHRGAQDPKSEYFGPFASAGAVNHTITALQRAFLLRSCSDSVFAGRTRPCLQYQIKRCSAPCVNRIAPEDYAELVGQAREFLSGNSRGIQQRLAERMQAASDALDFETAARYRDRIRGLTQIQAHQAINVAGIDEADVIAAHQAGGQTCIQVFFFRAGSNYGNRAYFPSHDRQLDLPDVLAAFLGQFYSNKPVPRLILLSHAPSEQMLLAEALALQASHAVKLLVPQRGDKRKLVDHATANARDALARRLSENATQRRLLEGTASVFGLDGPPNRIEVYDNSHISGRNPYGAMIVAGPDGLMKNAYRKFAIAGAGDDAPENAPRDAPRDAPGDDYAMMREVLTRRFARALKEDPERQGGTWPDLVLIDGGAGQLSVALQVFADLGISDQPVAAIAKGPDRNAGRERFFLPGREPFSLEPNDPVLYFLQRLRDEAHRFVIGTHRAKRSKQIGQSLLDEVPGIGARRKKALLHHFGSARNVARAGLADLEAVEGISGTVAKRIYDHFHGQG